MVEPDSNYIGLYNESTFDSSQLSAYEVDISNLLTVNSIQPYSGTTVTITGNLSITGNLNGIDPDTVIASSSIPTTDNKIARFDSTTGKLIQDSAVICDDSGNLTGVGTLNGITLTDIVTGPASNTDNAITRFNGTTGKIIQNSGVTIDDSNNIVTSGNITCTLVNGVDPSALTLQNIYDNSTQVQILTTVTNPTLALKDYSGVGSTNVISVADSAGGVNFTISANGNIVCGDINSVDIAQLYTDVATNTTNIATNTTNIATNTTNISTNTTNISTNTTNISTNASNISSLQTDVNGFPDELKNLTTSEIQQLENIGATTVSSTQWGYLGAMNQSVATTDTVTFSTVTATTGSFNTIQPSSGSLTTICGNTFSNTTNVASFVSTILVDDIGEYTSAHGVTIDSVLLKDNNVECNNLKAATSVQTDSIVEQTLNNGITIDGVVIKNGLVDGMDCSILKNITASEASQLENIGANTISSTQWGYISAMNQTLATNSNVSFSSITLATGSSFNNYQEFSNTSFTFTCGTQVSSFTTTVKATRIGSMVNVTMKWFNGTLSTTFPFSTNPYIGSSSTLDTAFRPSNDVHNDSRRQTGGTWGSGGNYIMRSDGTIRIYEEATQTSNWNSGSFTVETVSWSFSVN